MKMTTTALWLFAASGERDGLAVEGRQREVGRRGADLGRLRGRREAARRVAAASQNVRSVDAWSSPFVGLLSRRGERIFRTARVISSEPATPAGVRRSSCVDPLPRARRPAGRAPKASSRPPAGAARSRSTSSRRGSWSPRDASTRRTSESGRASSPSAGGSRRESRPRPRRSSGGGRRASCGSGRGPASRARRSAASRPECRSAARLPRSRSPAVLGRRAGSPDRPGLDQEDRSARRPGSNFQTYLYDPLKKSIVIS